MEGAEKGQHAAQGRECETRQLAHRATPARVATPGSPLHSYWKEPTALALPSKKGRHARQGMSGGKGRNGGGHALLLHLDLCLFQLINLLSNHLHFLKLAGYWRRSSQYTSHLFVLGSWSRSGMAQRRERSVGAGCRSPPTGEGQAWDAMHKKSRTGRDRWKEDDNLHWCSNSPVLLDWFSNSWRNWSNNSVRRELGAGTIPRCALYIARRAFLADLFASEKQEAQEEEGDWRWRCPSATKEEER